ncbi:hypothetical protein HYU13_02105, partial [Candidatus Woesearchaeota archaeon]|nr:hypothetical protein [Candidatus Woesearchaeota archaeon]
MNIYHFNVFPELVRRVEAEFGRRAENLFLTREESKRTFHWSVPGHGGNCLIGFKPEAALENLLVIGLDGFFHHFTYLVVQKMKEKYGDQLAYLHVDQHTDASINHHEYARFAYYIHAALGVPVYLLFEGSKDMKEFGIDCTGTSMVRLIRQGEEDKFYPSEKVLFRNGGKGSAHTPAAIVNAIREPLVYHSLDVDVFPMSEFATWWPLSLKRKEGEAKLPKWDYLPDRETGFTIARYRELLPRLIGGKELVGADITGISFNETICNEFLEKLKPNPDQSPEEFEAYKAFRRKDNNRLNDVIRDTNERAMLNALGIMRFWQPHLDRNYLSPAHSCSA